MAQLINQTVHPIYGDLAEKNANRVFLITGTKVPVLLIEALLFIGMKTQEIVDDPAYKIGNFQLEVGLMASLLRKHSPSLRAMA